MAQRRFRVFDHAAVSKPPMARALSLKYKPAQEHILRRLGQAIVLHWQELPKVVQDVMVEQAALVADRDAGDHSVRALTTFIHETNRVR